jgi:hypothetical protein
MEELANHTSTCQKRNGLVTATNTTDSDDVTTYTYMAKATTAKLSQQDALQTTNITADVGAVGSVEVDVEVKWTGPSRWHSSHNKVCTLTVILVYLVLCSGTVNASTDCIMHW